MAKQQLLIQANSGIKKKLLKQNDHYKIPQNLSSLPFKISLHGKKMPDYYFLCDNLIGFLQVHENAYVTNSKILCLWEKKFERIRITQIFLCQNIFFLYREGDIEIGIDRLCYGFQSPCEEPHTLS